MRVQITYHTICDWSQETCLQPGRRRRAQGYDVTTQFDSQAGRYLIDGIDGISPKWTQAPDL